MAALFKNFKESDQNHPFHLLVSLRAALTLRNFDETQSMQEVPVPGTRQTVSKAGFWFAIAAFASTVAYCVVQLLQLYGALAYPMDEILIYGTSLCIVIPFLLAMLALHHTVPADKKFWSHGALIFSILYAVFVTANYVVQLATVIPMTMNDRLEEVRILQQTPHSMFWDFDALGYIFMGLATAIAIPVFAKQGFEKWVRIAFIANALMTPFISIVYFYPVYSYNLLILGFPWAVTAPAFMLLLALMFRKNARMRPDKRNAETKNSFLAAI